MPNSSRILPVILSGGAGTRLWPLSVKARPKQFLALTGSATMLQQTALRTAGRDSFQSPIVVASADHAEAVVSQLADVEVAPAVLILEPCGRNTAPAIALAALAAQPDDILLIMPSDHVIRDVEAFLGAVHTAAPFAEQGLLVTFGITPDRPETGYGYIRRGEALTVGVHAVGRFVEKPDRATAEHYCAEGCYDWNGGIFLFRAGRYLDALRTHAPEILDAAQAAMTGGRRDGVRLHLDDKVFGRSPSQSIDYAVMEKADGVAVVPVEMGWSDVGSWDALYDLGEQDGRGNVTVGPATMIDSKGCLIRSEGPRVVTIGIENLTVIVSGDTVLIVPRGDSQRVKEAVEALGL